MNANPSVIWAKTNSGRVEMQARALVKQRAQRNLLLLIDGSKSQESLLGDLAGIGVDDFEALRGLGLIAPVGAKAPASNDEPAGSDAAPLDYAQFTAALTQIIAKELGLRGFMLTLAVEKADTIDALQDVARRVLEQVRARKGEAAASAARSSLYGH